MSTVLSNQRDVKPRVVRLMWLLPMVLVLPVVVVPIGLAACHDPTQITLNISTDLDCSARLTTSIADGSPADLANVDVATTTTQCAPGGEIGTLVLVPSHSRDERLGVQVVMAVGVPLESCQAPLFGKDCIVARRSLSYIEHTGLTLPILMSSACKGVVCPDGQTCSAGACVSAEIDPNTCKDATGCASPPTSDASVADANATVNDSSIPVDKGDAAGDASVITISATPIITGRPNINSIASDASGVYWTEPGDTGPDGSVLFSTANGVLRLIADQRVFPSSIVLDATSVFWAEVVVQGIVRVPILGGAPTALPIAGGAGLNVTSIALDATHLYWINQSTPGSVSRVARDGSNEENIARPIANGPWAFAVGDVVSFVSSGSTGPGPGAVSTVPLSGGTPTLLSAADTSAIAALIVASGHNIAWATNDGGGSIMASTSIGIHPIATNQGGIKSLTSDATDVYWATSAGSSAGSAALVRAPWSGIGGPHTLYANLVNGGPVTVNATHVYLVDNGTILRFPK